MKTRIGQSILLACGLALAVACQQHTSVIDAIQKQGELVVVTRNAPTTYYELHDEPAGLEYEMSRAFARYLGVKPRYLIKDTTSEILATLKSGEADIAAAGLTKTTERQNSFLFGPIYQEVVQQVVCRRGGANPKKVEELNGFELRIAADTSYEEKFLELKKQHPGIEWKIDHEADTETLLEQVWLKKTDCTVADSNIVDINRRYYPELRVRFNLGEAEQLAWALPLKAEGLQDKINDWFEQYKSAGKLEALLEKHYGFIEVFDYVDTRRFVRRIHKVLPKYRKVFESAARKYKLDWQLLAAQSYQESHWRARAKSPTGVRGMMMLTLTTAREMGVKYRLDPKQSIHGGARYFHQLYKRIPGTVREPDRTWFALAAYNVGMGHLYDARTLAEQLDKDPDHWHDLSDVLPLLSHKKYYKTLKHGYARGREPVLYVDRIRDYHDILHQTLNQNN
ncbi:MAG: membrane-bound lytic murein transglycosylase MltF [Thioalkalispiraceae bacterium]|jgi:membrane-bound lytic murein transglycosylase F